jgi:hypothetical protein
MRSFQIIVLAALIVAVATYIRSRVTRGIRDDREFYASLLHRLSEVLGSKGFTISGPLVSPRVSGAHLATFEGPGSQVELIWDTRERPRFCLSDEWLVSRASRLVTQWPALMCRTKHALVTIAPRLMSFSMARRLWMAQPNTRLKLTARVDRGMNLSSARRSLSAIR